MPLTDVQRGRAVQFTAYGLVCSVLCLILVAGDWAAAKLLDASLANSEPAQIELRRSQTQDQRLIAEARRMGFHTMLYPELFDEPRWRPLAEVYGIAPLAPQPRTPLYYCNEGYGQVRYISDRFGFRNADAVWDLKRVDLVLIGDSFAQGACIPGNGTIAGILAKSRTILNLATGGNGPVEYAAIVKTFLPHIAAKYVAIVFCPNDNIDEEDSIYRKDFLDARPDYFAFDAGGRPIGPSLRLRRFYLEADREATRWISSTGNAEGQVARKGLVSHFGYYLGLPTIRALIANFWPFQTLPWSSKVAVDLLLAHCKSASCTPVFVYIPSSPFWRPDRHSVRYAALLQNYVTARGGRFVDASDDVLSRGRAAYAAAGPHLSPLGYSLVAKELAAALHR